MPRLTPRDTPGLRFFQVIQNMTEQFATTTEVWSAVKDAATQLGLPSAGISLQTMNTLRSYAATIRNASINFMEADPNQAIDSIMIGVAPWSNPLEVMNESPMYQIRVNGYATNAETGETEEVYRTITRRGQIAGTVGDMLGDIANDMEAMGEEYGQSGFELFQAWLIAV